MILFILWRIVSLNNCIHNVRVALIDLCAVILHIDIQEVHIFIYLLIGNYIFPFIIEKKVLFTLI